MFEIFTFHVHHFNALVLKCCDWFRQVGHVHQLALPCFCSVTLSSAQLCLSLSVVDCYCTLWNEILIRLFNVSYASSVDILLKNKLLCLLSSFCIFITGHSISSWNQIGIFTSERIHMLVTSVSLVPVYHRHSCLMPYSLTALRASVRP